MPRGGRSIGSRSHGHSYGHSHHHHHHGHYGGRGVASSGADFSVAIDQISDFKIYSSVVNGVYTLSGSQINVMARLN